MLTRDFGVLMGPMLQNGDEACSACIANGPGGGRAERSKGSQSKGAGQP